MGLSPTAIYASISWLTTIVPSCVAMAVPDLAVMTKAVSRGPSSLVMTMISIEYMSWLWPNCGRRLWPITLIAAPIAMAMTALIASAS